MPLTVRPFYWLFLPLLLLGFNIIAEIFVPQEYKPHFYSEGGPIEKIQEIILLTALIYAVRLCWKVRTIWLRLWFGIAALSCLYVGGEEISWGQSYFGWATPDYWLHVNDQQETNLHNTSAWLDQKPKILLQIGVLVGGLIIPALARWKPQVLPVKYSSIYPTWHLAVTTLLALFMKSTDVIEDITQVAIFERSSEILELYLYYFVLLYLAIMWKRFSQDSYAGAK